MISCSVMAGRRLTLSREAGTTRNDKGEGEAPTWKPRKRQTAMLISAGGVRVSRCGTLVMHEACSFARAGLVSYARPYHRMLIQAWSLACLPVPVVSVC